MANRSGGLLGRAARALKGRPNQVNTDVDAMFAASKKKPKKKKKKSY